MTDEKQDRDAPRKPPNRDGTERRNGRVQRTETRRHEKESFNSELRENGRRKESRRVNDA